MPPKPKPKPTRYLVTGEGVRDNNWLVLHDPPVYPASNSKFQRIPVPASPLNGILPLVRLFPVDTPLPTTPPTSSSRPATTPASIPAPPHESGSDAAAAAANSSPIQTPTPSAPSVPTIPIRPRNPFRFRGSASQMIARPVTSRKSTSAPSAPPPPSSTADSITPLQTPPSKQKPHPATSTPAPIVKREPPPAPPPSVKPPPNPPPPSAPPPQTQPSPPAIVKLEKPTDVRQSPQPAAPTPIPSPPKRVLTPASASSPSSADITPSASKSKPPLPASPTSPLNKKKKADDAKSRLRGDLKSEMLKDQKQALGAVLKGLHVSSPRSKGALPPLQKVADPVANSAQPAGKGDRAGQQAETQGVLKTPVSVVSDPPATPDPSNTRKEVKKSAPTTQSRIKLEQLKVSNAPKSDANANSSPVQPPKSSQQISKSLPLPAKDPAKPIKAVEVSTPAAMDVVPGPTESAPTSKDNTPAPTNDTKLSVNDNTIAMEIDSGIEVVSVVHSKAKRIPGLYASVKDSPTESKPMISVPRDTTQRYAAIDRATSKLPDASAKQSQRSSTTEPPSPVVAPSTPSRSQVGVSKVEPTTSQPVSNERKRPEVSQGSSKTASASHEARPSMVKTEKSALAERPSRTHQDEENVVPAQGIAIKQDSISASMEGVSVPTQSKKSARKGPSLKPPYKAIMESEVQGKGHRSTDPDTRAVNETRRQEMEDAVHRYQNTSLRQARREASGDKQKESDGRTESSKKSRKADESRSHGSKETVLKSPVDSLEGCIRFVIEAVCVYQSRHELNGRSGADLKQILVGQIRNQLKVPPLPKTKLDTTGASRSSSAQPVSIPKRTESADTRAAAPKKVPKAPQPVVDQRPPDGDGRRTSHSKKEMSKRTPPVERGRRETLASVSLIDVENIGTMWSTIFHGGERPFDDMAEDMERIEEICDALESPWPETLTISDNDLLKYIRNLNDLAKPGSFLTKVFEVRISKLQRGKISDEAYLMARAELKDIMNSIGHFLVWIHYFTKRMAFAYNSAVSSKQELFLGKLKSALNDMFGLAAIGGEDEAIVKCLRVMKKTILEPENEDNIPFPRRRKALREAVRLRVSELGKIYKIPGLIGSSPKPKGLAASSSGQLDVPPIGKQLTMSAGAAAERQATGNRASSSKDAVGRDVGRVSNKAGKQTIEKMHGKERAPREQSGRWGSAPGTGSVGSEKRSAIPRLGAENSGVSGVAKSGMTGPIDITIPRRKVSDIDKTIDVDKVSGSGVQKGSEAVAGSVHKNSRTSENAKHVRKLLSSSPSMGRSVSDSGRNVSVWNSGSSRRGRGILRPAPTDDDGMEPALKKRRGPGVRFASQLVKGVRASELESDEVKALFHEGYDILGNGKDIQSRAVEERCGSLSRGSVIAFFGFLKNFVSAMKDEMEGRQTTFADTVELPYPPSAQKAIARMVQRQNAQASVVENGRNVHSR